MTEITITAEQLRTLANRTSTGLSLTVALLQAAGKIDEQTEQLKRLVGALDILRTENMQLKTELYGGKNA